LLAGYWKRRGESFSEEGGSGELQSNGDDVPVIPYQENIAGAVCAGMGAYAKRSRDKAMRITVFMKGEYLLGIDSKPLAFLSIKEMLHFLAGRNFTMPELLLLDFEIEGGGGCKCISSD